MQEREREGEGREREEWEGKRLKGRKGGRERHKGRKGEGKGEPIWHTQLLGRSAATA